MHRPLGLAPLGAGKGLADHAAISARLKRTLTNSMSVSATATSPGEARGRWTDEHVARQLGRTGRSESRNSAR